MARHCQGTRPVSAEPSQPRLDRGQLLIGLALVALTAAAYTSVLQAPFIHYGTDQLVTNNPDLRLGLSFAGIRWAFTTTLLGSWHPLTWLSLLADYQLFGLSPRAFHGVNLLLHLLGTALCFAAMEALTGQRWKSAFVAAVFGLHPAHVESVAWVAERKDVLSGVFFMLTLLFYARAVRQGATRSGMIPVAMSLLLGLMSKAMLVTLPFVLLLLDDWPLERLRNEGRYSAGLIGQAVLEKLPLFALSLAFAGVVLLSQDGGGTMGSLGSFSLVLRLGSAIVSYLAYLQLAFWPVGLGIFYPFADGPTLVTVALSAGALATITAAALWARLELGFLRTGWLWYLGMLVPVIGLVQIGFERMADRYTYLPFVGLSIVVAWGVPAVVARGRAGARVAAAAGAVAIALLGVLTWQQVQHWRGTIALFERTIAMTGPNALAEYQLGVRYTSAGELELAEAHMQRAVEINPYWSWPRFGLGIVYDKNDKPVESATLLAQGLEMDPIASDFPGASLGIMLLIIDVNGGRQVGLHYLAQAYAVSAARTLGSMAGVLALGGEAAHLTESLLEEAVRERPELDYTRGVLAEHAIRTRRPRRAVRHYRAILRQEYDPAIASALAYVLARDALENAMSPNEPLELAEEAARRTEHRDAYVLGRLAGVYAALGRFDEAAATAEQGVALAKAAGQGELTDELRAHARAYRARAIP